ncbi:MAG: hypothetical protein QG566_439 [Patescibacteria group bacterium]|jgi:hypothetical protein|nr:hypothetical protein [Patescibacteria group bacterium]
MNIKKLLTTNGILLSLVLVSVIILLGLIIYSFFLSPQPNNNNIQTKPHNSTPTPTPFDISNIPNATPQLFRNDDEEKNGTLVVTSNVPGVQVHLDATGHPDPEDPIPPGQKWPTNITPFKVDSIPIGEHFIFAAKPPLYDTQVVKFVITENQITTIELKMVRLQISN